MVTGWSNYHAHTKFCDGRATMEESIERAIEDNVKILGFSSHAPVPFHTEWTMKSALLEDYVDVLSQLKKKYSGQIEILKSLEIDYIPNMINPHSFEHCNLDYTIGSIHFVDAYSDGTPWSFDGGTEEFSNGLTKIFNGDIVACAKRYFHLVREMLWLYPPHILGHFDKIKMHNSKLPLFDEADNWYVDEIDKTIDVIKQTGVIVEINTKSFDRDMKIFPGIDLFPKLAKLNIPVTINSDSHHIDKMIIGYEYVANELLKSGYATTREYIKGQWIDVPLSAKGLELPI